MMTNEKIIEHLDQMIQACKDVKAEDKAHKDAKTLASLVIRDCNLLKQKINQDHLQLVT
jgi:hypothetical protein